MEIDLDLVQPGRHQPRGRFDEQRVLELADSIRQSGVLQPVLVVRDGDGYVLVAGERRWRAAQRAGLHRIPAIVRDVPEDRRLEVALVENLQREDLNPIEEARAYRTLVRDLGVTQAEIAQRVGKTRPTVANTLRLLELPESVQALVEEGRLPMGHARALLGLEDPAAQKKLAGEAARKGLSAREVEARVQRLRRPPAATRASRRIDPNVAAAEEDLSRALRVRVRIRPGGKNQGRIELHYGGEEELQRLYEVLHLAGKKL